jgi:hypothetical protein
VIFDFSYYLSHCVDDALHVQGTTQDPPPLHFDSIVRPLGLTILDAQETQKLVPPVYHDFLPLFLEKGLQWLPPKRPSIDHEINLKPDL